MVRLGQDGLLECVLAKASKPMLRQLRPSEPTLGGHHLAVFPCRVKVNNTHRGILEREAREDSVALYRLLVGKQGTSSLVFTSSWCTSLLWPQPVCAKNPHSCDLNEHAPRGSDVCPQLATLFG